VAASAKRRRTAAGVVVRQNRRSEDAHAGRAERAVTPVAAMPITSFERYPLLFGPSPVQAARTEGMVTDPVYEGKSMAGLVDLVTRGEIARDSTVLYVHLGSQPALNAYSALFG
jgi:hypothetical protein